MIPNKLMALTPFITPILSPLFSPRPPMISAALKNENILIWLIFLLIFPLFARISNIEQTITIAPNKDNKIRVIIVGASIYNCMALCDFT